MDWLNLGRIFDFLYSVQFGGDCSGPGRESSHLDLTLLMETRWGRSRLTPKCLVLSVLFHLLVAGYLVTLSVVTPPWCRIPGPVHVSLSEEPLPGGTGGASARQRAGAGPIRPALEYFPSRHAAAAGASRLARRPTAAAPPIDRKSLPRPAALPGEVPLGELALAPLAESIRKSCPARRACRT